MGDYVQQQEDEVLVLQSIFGDDYVPIIPGAQFELRLSVTLPYPIHVLLPEPQVTPKILPFSHLPPIVLQVTFHKDYPEKYPPGFSLSCVWLSRAQLTGLVEKMDDIWMTSPGEVVVYNWAEFLREQTIEHLSLLHDKKLSLAGNDSETHLDPRALSLYRPKIALHVLRHMFDYNREVIRKEFVFQEHTCRICYTESPGKDFLHLACGDSYCRDCLTEFVGTFVKEGTIESLICPNTECRAPLLPTDVQNCTTDELYDRFERLTLQRGLEMMGDEMVKCPRCKETVITDTQVYGKDGDSEFCSFAMCASCVFPFCSRCFHPWQPKKPCPTLRAKNKAEITTILARAPNSWTHDEAGLVNEYMTVMALAKTSKGCPKCGTRIQKSSGCNKMTCSRCHSYFCWLCGESIRGYDHFHHGGCVLFEEEGGVGVAQGIEENVQLGVDDILKQGKFKTGNCPKCDSINFKINPSNLMVCWSCRFPFCFICSEPCFGKFHFTSSSYNCPEFGE
eukprot:Phypoly_transcript_07162.p1 GENE.Phypoly_transcript_07162~~Phypoly_transcript_07162.p1  ORF type:complete len:506 (+),score=42.65 Phypoly_transcript_07162:109-1626(+)